MTATMDFFEHQDVARKKTGQLVLMFIAAVIGIVVLIYLVTMGIFAYGQREAGEAFSWWNWRVFLGVTFAVLLVVGLASLYKTSVLGAGGHVVAEMLGGELITQDTRDPQQRKVLNVVEEMAIASGTPVPPVYLMSNEMGINAFAAGYSPSDAVIGVTRGCMEKLSRDELQGVIAHEFSHVLNGDMRLNIRLIGVIHGILVIGLIGWFVFRSALYSGAGRRRSSSKDSNPLPIIAFGLALMIIGYIGTFFGSMIKAAVSRQREYLADASAVQFTRHPQGIGGALMKIGGYSHGSEMDNGRASEVSHMFFSQGVSSALQSMFATHPPLPDRIKRVLPSWQGQFPHVSEDFVAMEGAADSALAGAAGFAAAPTRQRPAVAPQPTEAIELAGDEQAVAPTEAEPSGDAMHQIGQPTTRHIAYAHELLEALPPAIRDAAHEPFSARALIFALLRNDEAEPRAAQMQRIEQYSDEVVYKETRKLADRIGEVDLKARLPLIDMAIGSLKEMSPGQYGAFRTNVVELIAADSKVDVFEWVLQRVVLHHLDLHFGQARRPRVRYKSLKLLTDRAAVLLSSLSYVGHESKEAAAAAFDAGAKRLGVEGLSIQPLEKCGLRALNDAIDKLATVTPQLKKKLLSACAGCIAADKQITVGEGELFRAVADSLDCPVPPLLPGQALG